MPEAISFHDIAAAAERIPVGPVLSLGEGEGRNAAYLAGLGHRVIAVDQSQVGLTKGLALELGPAGIRVNAILPSNIDTPLMREWASTLPNPQEGVDRMARLQVFNRLGTPEEIGRVALFLATEDSSFLTGQAIEAEGGSSLDY